MRIILGGIIRNIEANIKTIFTFIHLLKIELPTLEVCLYENNSTDKTKSFSELKSVWDYLDIKFEDYDEEFFIKNFPGRTYDNKGCRIDKIAFARNKLLEMIEKKNLTENDFVIMMDLDINNMPDVQIIAHTIRGWPKDIHALFANGVQKNGHYYDGYEFRSEQLPYGPEILGETFWSDAHMANIQHKYEISQGLIPVISAFGGFAIYRADIIKDCRYSADVTDELHEHYTKYPIIDSKPQTHYQGCSLGLYLKDSKIFYKNNSGYNYPVCAEHVNFHLAIRKKGFTNMFICPFLYYYWG